MPIDMHVGDVGVLLEMTVCEDGVPISVVGMTLVDALRLQKPDVEQTGTDYTVSFKTDGADGIVQYTTVTDDLDLPGIWHLQLTVTIGPTTFHTDLVPFMVLPNLHDPPDEE